MGWERELTVYTFLVLKPWEWKCYFLKQIFLNNRSDFGPAVLLIWAVGLDQGFLWSEMLHILWLSSLCGLFQETLALSDDGVMVYSPFHWWPGPGSAQTVWEGLGWGGEQGAFCRGVRPCSWEFIPWEPCPDVTQLVLPPKWRITVKRDCSGAFWQTAVS